MKKILITGANSYIGMSFEKYVKEGFANEYTVDTADMIDGTWREMSFSEYDSVFHVAGIAHQRETKKNAHSYYEINRDLAIETAKKAKALCFDIFGTTLTVSPHKNAELINSIGLAIEKEIGIKYLVSNFKKQDGYKRSIELSKENNIYRQNYCGCEFALKIQMAEAPESLNRKY